MNKQAAQDWFDNVFSQSKEWGFQTGYNGRVSGSQVDNSFETSISPIAQIFECVFNNYGLTTSIQIECLDGEVICAWMYWNTMNKGEFKKVKREIEIAGDCAWKKLDT